MGTGRERVPSGMSLPPECGFIQGITLLKQLFSLVSPIIQNFRPAAKLPISEKLLNIKRRKELSGKISNTYLSITMCQLPGCHYLYTCSGQALFIPLS